MRRAIGRLGIALAGAAVAAVAGASSALADEGQRRENRVETGDRGVTVEARVETEVERSSDGDGGNGAGGSITVNVELPPMAPQPRLRHFPGLEIPGGLWCVEAVEWVAFDTQAQADAARERLARNRDRDPLEGGWFDCSDDPEDEPDPLEVPEPEIDHYAVIEEFVDEIPFAEPEPYIDPGVGVTGITSYLQPGGWDAEPVSTDTGLFGLLEMSFASEYVIDWGDGTTEGPTDAEGGPYPDGDLTHVYEAAEPYEIVVCQRWTADWEWDGEGETGMPGPEICSDPYELAVEEIQAVRQR